VKHSVDDNLELRSYEDRDAHAIFDIVKANYEHLRPYLHWVTPNYTIETAKEFIAQRRVAELENAGQAFGIFFWRQVGWGDRICEFKLV